MIKHLYTIIRTKQMGVLADQALFSGNSFLVTLVFARLLGPDSFGTLTSVVLLVYLLTSGVGAFVIQPFQVASSQHSSKPGYITFTVLLQAVLVFIALLLTWILLQFDIELLRGIYEYSFWVLLYVGGFLFNDFFRKYFLSGGRIKEVLIIDVLFTVVQAGSILAIYLMHTLLLEQSFMVLALSTIPSNLLSLFFVKPVINSVQLWRSYFLTHVKQGSWLFSSAIIQWWSNNLFVVASGVFLGAKLLGVFRLVQSLFGILNILLQTVENYIIPQAAKKLTISEADSKQYIKQLSRKGVVVFGTLLTLLFVFSEPVLLNVAGEEYAGFGYVIQGMCILYLVIFLGYSNRIAIRMLVLNQHFFIGYVLTFGVSIFLFNYLLQNWALTGAIAGLIINQLVLLIYWQIILYKRQFILWK